MTLISYGIRQVFYIRLISNLIFFDQISFWFKILSLSNSCRKWKSKSCNEWCEVRTYDCCRVEICFVIFDTATDGKNFQAIL